MDKFKVGLPHDTDDEDNWAIREAIDAEDAAEEYVEAFDDGSLLSRGTEIETVIVIDMQTGARTTWQVSCEMVPEYWAEEL